MKHNPHAQKAQSLIVAGLLLFLPVKLCCGADWQFCGYTKMDNVDTYQFFDSAGIERPARDTVKVWVKSIPQRNLDQYLRKNEKEVIRQAALKLRSDGPPKYFQMESIKRIYPDKTELENIIADVLMFQVIANEGDVRVSNRFHFEFDCAGRRMRLLEGQVYGDDGVLWPQIGSRQSADYKSIAPDTNGAWLSQLVCVPR